MRSKFLTFLLLVLVQQTFAQKLTGFGAEASLFSLKPNIRLWLSNNAGFELFGGLSAEVYDLKPDDQEVGFKLFKTITYNRTDRLYFGLMGKWKLLTLDYNVSTKKTNCPVGGIFVGKEWFTKRINRTGFAVEFGYQYGSIQNPESNSTRDKIQEFPVILNIRYTFYQKTKRY